MKAQLRHIYKKLFERRGLVLMYHRIAEPTTDIWEIAVSPANFEAHLQVLKKMGTVVSLKELVNGVKTGKVKKNSIAITFDDGYADNYLMAKPLLEKYGLPATFFVASGNIDQTKEFWWDELENLLLFTPTLPLTIELTLGNQFISDSLAQEAELTQELVQKHRNWNACFDAPPTKRAQLFFQLWQCLKPLPYAQQKTGLQQIRAWAGTKEKPRPDFVSMSAQQLRELASHRLFDIGAHTVNHIALASHDKTLQEQEISQNRGHLQDLTGKEIDLIAYPYGNYNKDSMEAAENLRFAAAFTTHAQVVTRHSNLYQLGRLQVPNWPQDVFRREIKAMQDR